MSQSRRIGKAMFTADGGEECELQYHPLFLLWQKLDATSHIEQFSGT